MIEFLASAQSISFANIIWRRDCEVQGGRALKAYQHNAMAIRYGNIKS
jgi:hypothetical protein